MIKPHQIYRIINSIVALLLMAACANQPSKLITTEKDVFEIEKLAIAAYDKNDWVESEKHYSELVKRIPEDPQHWFRLGNVYTRTQRPDAAIIAYREALIRDPKMAKAWHNMGVLHLRQAANSFDQLRVYVEKDDPLYPQSQILLNGIIDLIQGNNDESKQSEMP